jgi:hypothetical protein
MNNTITVELAEYQKFLRFFHKGWFGQQRLGQAFVNHFKLHKMVDKTIENILWELDGEKAEAALIEHVTFQ